MSSKKSLDFNVDLIPVISLLSVCICFLLLTAVWVQVGSMKVKQGIGGQSLAETAKQPMLVLKMLPGGGLQASLRDFQKPGVAALSGVKLLPQSQEQMEDFARWLGPYVEKLKNLEPNLQSALIEPDLQAEYHRLVSLMDFLKSQGLSELGVIPL
jgi:biopolymer transport protein ExbD